MRLLINLWRRLGWYQTQRKLRQSGWAQWRINHVGSAHVQLHTFAAGGSKPRVQIYYVTVNTVSGRFAYAKVYVTSMGDDRYDVGYGPDSFGIRLGHRLAADTPVVLDDLFAECLCLRRRSDLRSFYEISRLHRELRNEQGLVRAYAEHHRTLVAAMRRLCGNRQAGYQRLLDAEVRFGQQVWQYNDRVISAADLLSYAEKPIDAGGQIISTS